MKDTVKQVKQTFLDNKQKVLEGKLVGLPLYESFPKLGQFIPVIPPAIQVMITAGSGVGKSNSWIGLLLLTVYKLKKKHPKNNYKFRFLISLLEDSKEDFIAKLYSAVILHKFNKRTDVLELNSRRGAPLPKEIESLLDSAEEEINELLSYCEINDSVYNPTGIYKWGRAISNKIGTHYTKEMDFSDDKGGTYKHEVYSHYVPNDPDEQVIWVIDNLNNLQTEKGETRLETINKWTSRYGRLQITKHWKWNVINILQQAAESEKPQFDLRGNLIVERCKVSLDGLGNSKECQRDHILIFGLWAPNRFGIGNYEGYNIDRLKDAYRSFIILKSNISETNKEIPMYFDGATSVYKELPSADKMSEDTYRKIETRTVTL